MEEGKATEKVKSRSSSKAKAAKRVRHQCIAISPTSPATLRPAIESLTIDSIPEGTPRPESKSRSKSISVLQTESSSAQINSVADCYSTRSQSLPRSISLQEFSEYDLPGNLSAPARHLPSTPSKTLKHSRFVTRRSSSIQGEVFTCDELEFGRTLGIGFFGKAIQVKHRKTGNTMVVKELLTCDEDAKKSFLKEAAVLRGLSHPKLLKYIGFLYKEKDLHIVTEYIPGGTLEQLLQKSENIPSLIKLGIAIDIASAMEYLHSQQVIHRDLNSPNCLLRADGSAVVADFGLSKLVQDNADHSNSPTQKSKSRKKRHTVVGNPYWMAPEMLRGEQYDERVDVFSFGIILCEIIGQVKADPDYMPRSANFALDELSFMKMFGGICPPEFYEHAFICCQIVADDRPSFQTIHKDLIRFYKFYTVSESRILRQTALTCPVSVQLSQYRRHPA